MTAADCGVTFWHEPHAYRTPRGKVKACDGSTTKRLSPSATAALDVAHQAAHAASEAAEGRRGL